MRQFVYSILTQFLTAGHNAIILCGIKDSIPLKRIKLIAALKDIGTELSNTDNDIVLSNGARAQILHSDAIDGNGLSNTPVLVITDVDKVDPRLVADARRLIPCKFPDGRPPIIIEC
jgi:hypothetical protein